MITKSVPDVCMYCTFKIITTLSVIAFLILKMIDLISIKLYFAVFVYLFYADRKSVV